MLLAIDIGNSLINIGLFSGKALIGSTKIPAHPVNIPEFYRDFAKNFLSKMSAEGLLEGIAMSAVVPELAGAFNKALKGLCRRDVLNVAVSLNTGMTFDVETPEEVGADRIANAVAAKETFGQPVIVVDFGTATTLSAVRDNRFIGGAILPGLGLMRDALSAGTAKLPAADIAAIRGAEFPALGKATAGCIISGIIYGSAGAAERLIKETEAEEGCSFGVVITGGYSGIMSRFLKRDFNLAHTLTLSGLRILHERNT